MNTDDTTIEQVTAETPEVEDLSDEALDRTPGRGEVCNGFCIG